MLFLAKKKRFEVPLRKIARLLLLSCFYYCLVLPHFWPADYNCTKNMANCVEFGMERSKAHAFFHWHRSPVIKSCFTTPETRCYLVFDRTDRLVILSWRYGSFEGIFSHSFLIEACEFCKNYYQYWDYFGVYKCE